LIEISSYLFSLRKSKKKGKRNRIVFDDSSGICERFSLWKINNSIWVLWFNCRKKQNNFGKCVERKRHETRVKKILFVFSVRFPRRKQIDSLIMWQCETKIVCFCKGKKWLLFCLWNFNCKKQTTKKKKSKENSATFLLFSVDKATFLWHK